MITQLENPPDFSVTENSNFCVSLYKDGGANATTFLKIGNIGSNVTGIYIGSGTFEIYRVTVSAQNVVNSTRELTIYSRTGVSTRTTLGTVQVAANAFRSDTTVSWTSSELELEAATTLGNFTNVVVNIFVRGVA